MKPDYLSIYKTKEEYLINQKKAERLINKIKESKYCNLQTRELLNNIDINRESKRVRNWRNNEFFKNNLFVYFECEKCEYCSDKRSIGKVLAYCDQSFHLFKWTRSNNSYADIFNNIINLYGGLYIYYDRITLESYEEIVSSTTPQNILDSSFRIWPRKLFSCVYKNEYNDPFEIIIPFHSNGNERLTFCVNKKYIFLFDWTGS